jgi:hypothetical protein
LQWTYISSRLCCIGQALLPKKTRVVQSIVAVAIVIIIVFIAIFAVIAQILVIAALIILVIVVTVTFALVTFIIIAVFSTTVATRAAGEIATSVLLMFFDSLTLVMAAVAGIVGAVIP